MVIGSVCMISPDGGIIIQLAWASDGNHRYVIHFPGLHESEFQDVWINGLARPFRR
jgi:hypothetical protein